MGGTKGGGEESRVGQEGGNKGERENTGREYRKGGRKGGWEESRVGQEGREKGRKGEQGIREETEEGKKEGRKAG